MKLFDTTLRDGGNVVGHGFSAELTVNIVEGLLSAGIQDIELGNCKGIGAYEKLSATKALSDAEYFELLRPYADKGRLGMFVIASLADARAINAAADAGMTFLRVGANAGDGKSALDAIHMVKSAGLYCRYALMKGYVLSPEELAEEAKLLQDAGADCVTIMDSAGTMFPQETARYVRTLKAALSIPVGFHGHSNLGLSQANALAAAEAGADEIDCGLLGMARSAGNCATELAAATLKKEGYLPEVDLYKLLDYLEQSLIPAMKVYDYHAAVDPTALMLGLAGCHSNYLPMFAKVAKDEGVSLLRLIADVSAIDRKAPSEALLRQVAATLR